MLSGKVLWASLCSIIFVCLLILKSLGVMTISWWWVFAPIFISVGLGFVIAIIFFMMAIFVWICEDVIKFRNVKEKR